MTRKAVRGSGGGPPVSSDNSSPQERWGPPVSHGHAPAVLLVGSGPLGVRAIGTAPVDDLSRPEFRGCAFLKAAAEFPDPEDPVRRVVAEHRAWYVATLTDLFAQVFGSSPRRGRPDHAAQHFLMMRDGAMSGADIDGAAHVGDAFHRGLDGLLTLLH
ncbi:hypothetical protein [Pseudonocardia sp. ICBG162]|uniref:hypothetical protein n=1 Tax=Pseudonocardia sp. ICBG162 TaxID=2846761 RepID=UPI001CF70262|nr:hypothetical protein [Pseudonocardia sp. ICBG162]